MYKALGFSLALESKTKIKIFPIPSDDCRLDELASLPMPSGL